MPVWRPIVNLSGSPFRIICIKLCWGMSHTGARPLWIHDAALYLVAAALLQILWAPKKFKLGLCVSCWGCWPLVIISAFQYMRLWRKLLWCWMLFAYLLAKRIDGSSPSCCLFWSQYTWDMCGGLQPFRIQGESVFCCGLIAWSCWLHFLLWFCLSPLFVIIVFVCVMCVRCVSAFYLFP